MTWDAAYTLLARTDPSALGSVAAVLIVALVSVHVEIAKRRRGGRHG